MMSCLLSCAPLFSWLVVLNCVIEEGARHLDDVLSVVVRPFVWLVLNCVVSSSAFPAISLGFTILGEIFACVTVFESSHRGSHIPSSWMAHAGCVFVASIHPSRI